MRLAMQADRDAFEQLVLRRQNWIRNLMRRCCGDAGLADDLAQEAFMRAWQTVHNLQKPNRFAAWLKRIAINTWLQRARKSDPLKTGDALDGTQAAPPETPDVGMDLDQALAALSEDARLCIVLAYHERMTHEEISTLTALPLGTVKSHVRRGVRQLKDLLSEYREPARAANEEQ